MPQHIRAALADPAAGSIEAQIVRLRDAAVAMLAMVAHRPFGIGLVPLEAVQDFLAAPLQRVLQVAMRARDVKPHPHVHGLVEPLDVAQATPATGAAPDALRISRALDPLANERIRRAGAFDRLLKAVQLVGAAL